MILHAIAAKLKQRSKADFRGRHFEATLVVQAVPWYLRYPLSYRDIEELFLERGLEVDHSTLNRSVPARVPRVWIVSPGDLRTSPISIGLTLQIG